ncbi:glycoside hydrolase family 3 N-terminal domain-containing protein [Enterococcus aquimarinus]|uniref:beta-N-acetylhexosaminidase n=1 Tax=Enterococcus aquimarinus TaxID=328396 RepID=A0A1L8QQW7_9ENTE|nr:glycoside hydrolase family 3 N-terminal domain-containing protein [Enterococcus aquimarinus]OJG09880.1 beta-hexosaminidase [Enterococcus aquimarinus]
MNKQTLASLGLLALALIVGVMIWFNQPSNDATGPTDTSSTTSTETTTSTTATQPSTTRSSDNTTESTTAPNESTTWLDQKIAEMSIAEKVGQLFLVRYPGDTALTDSQMYHLGGFLLFGQDVENATAESLITQIQTLQANSEIPLLIGADEEGGTVTRISRNANLVASPFLAPQTLYQNGGWEAITADTKQKAEILTNYGIQLGLFPVADVSTDPNAFIYDRTIGLDAAGTSTFVETVVKSLAGTGVASTLKHFPGYGNNRDSHVEIVRDTRTLEELRTNDFLPFEAGIKAGADSILVSHNIVTSIDDTQPASLSPKVIQVLREELGFEGVIMTDDMDMLGLADFTSQEQAGLTALKAGNDLVLSSSYASQIPVVITAVENGDYPEADLDASVRRILTLKESLGLLNE